VIPRKVGHQSRWTIDILRSPAISARRCFCDGSILREGRLFLEAGFYENDGMWRDKPSAFLNRANTVFKTTRQLFRRDPSLSAYVGRHADAWRKQTGGKFVDK